MIRFAALLACLSLVACAQPYEAALIELPPSLALSIRVQADSVDVAAVVEAAEEWQEATGGYVKAHVEIVDSNDGTGVYMNTQTSSPKSLGNTTCVGCYPAVMLLNPPLIASRKDSTAGIIMHELGHVMGLDHAAHGLMYPTDSVTNWAPCIDADTLAAFCATHECPASAHSTCR
jgi:predicted Zn-dependent protease